MILLKNILIKSGKIMIPAILSLLLIFGCGGGISKDPLTPDDHTDPEPTGDALFEIGRVVRSAYSSDSEATEFTWEGTKIRIPANILPAGTLINLHRVTVSPLIADGVLGEPVVIRFDGYSELDENQLFEISRSDMPLDALSGDFDIIRVKRNPEGMEEFGYGWIIPEEGHINMFVSYDPDAIYAIVSSEGLSEAYRGGSSYGEDIPILTNTGSMLGHDNPPGKVNIIFIHGLDLAKDNHLVGVLTKDHRTMHWGGYAMPGDDNSGLLDEVNCRREHIQMWWYFYSTVHKPVFGSDGNARALADKIKTQIIDPFVLEHEEQPAIILAGYSMGAMVSLAAYDSLVSDHIYDYDVVDAIITLNGVNTGTEWVNIAARGKIGKYTGSFLGVPYWSCGVQDLRSIYNVEYEYWVTIWPHHSPFPIPVWKSKDKTRRPNSTLREIRQKSFISNRLAKTRNPYHYDQCGDAWFYPLASHVEGGFGIIKDLLIRANRMFSAILNYDENLNGQFDTAADESLLRRLAMQDEPFGYPLHDGIVPYYSQEGLSITSPKTSAWSHDDDHLEVVDEKKGNYYRNPRVYRELQLSIGGIANRLLLCPPCAPQIQPPVWDGLEGIQSAVPSDKSITVTFGTANDPQGKAIFYDLYYVNQTQTGNSDPFNMPREVVTGITSPYTLTGLTNDHRYWLGVRARNSDGLSEYNEVKLSATPSAPQPPIWVKEEGITSTNCGPDSIYIEYGTAVDPLGGHVFYDLYFVNETQTENTNPFSAPNEIVEDIGESPYRLEGLELHHRYYLGVRVRNSEGLSDTNTVIRSSKTDYPWKCIDLGLPKDILDLGERSIDIPKPRNLFPGKRICIGGSTCNDGFYKVIGWEDLFTVPPRKRLHLDRNLPCDVKDGYMQKVIYEGGGLHDYTRFAGGAAGKVQGKSVASFANDSYVVGGLVDGAVDFGQGLNPGSNGDSYIAKYSPAGSIEWVNRLTCSTGYRDYTTSAITSAPGSIPIVWTGGLYDSSGTVPPESAIHRYREDGQLVTTASISGGISRGIVALNDDSIVLTGTFSERATFAWDPHEIALDPVGDTDIFIARYNPDLTLQWAKRAGGINDVEAYSVAALPGGSTVITGRLTGKAIFGEGEPNETAIEPADTFIEPGDTFIAKYNPDGTLAWAKHAGGSGFSAGTSVAYLESYWKGWPPTTTKAIVITGHFNQELTFGKGELNETTIEPADTFIEPGDTFLAAFDPDDGTLIWAKTAAFRGKGLGIAAVLSTPSDPRGRIFVTGSFSGEGTRFGRDEYQMRLNAAGVEDMFIAKFNIDGTLAWASSAGGTGMATGNGITMLSDNHPLVVGSFNGSTTFGRGEPGEFTLNAAGQLDLFVSKFIPIQNSF